MIYIFIRERGGRSGQTQRRLRTDGGRDGVIQLPIARKPGLERGKKQTLLQKSMALLTP